MSRRRRPRKVSAGGLDWEGATLAEARAARDRWLEENLPELGGNPALVLGPEGSVGVVWRGLHGWEYSIWRRSSQSPGGIRQGGTTCGHGSRASARRALGRHFAQQAYGLEDDDGFGHLVEGDDEGAEEHGRWVDWQRRYAHLTNVKGLSPERARRVLDGWETL